MIAPATLIVLGSVGRDGFAGYDARDGVLVHQLRGLARRIEKYGERVETSDLTPQLNAVREIDGDADPLFAHLVDSVAKTLADVPDTHGDAEPLVEMSAQLLREIRGPRRGQINVLRQAWHIGIQVDRLRPKENHVVTAADEMLRNATSMR